jgi:hypothetical protein
MKKITGKVVSLVLALALVVTSFSSSFAFASTKTMSGTVNSTKNDDKIYLVNGGGATKNVVPNLESWTQGEVETKDHKAADSVKITAISHVSGDKLVSLSVDSSTKEATLKLKSNTADGKEVVNVLYEGSWTNDDGDEYTVKASKELTVYVFDKDAIVFGKYATKANDNTTADKDSGHGLDDVDTIAQTRNSTDKIGIYQAEQSADDAKAIYKVATGLSLSSQTNKFANAGFVVDITSGESNIHTNLQTQSSTGNTTIDNKDSGYILVTSGTGTKSATGLYPNNSSVGNVTFSVKKLVTTTDNGPYKASPDSDYKYTLKTKVEKKVDVAAEITNGTLSTSSAFSIAKSSGVTYLTNTNSFGSVTVTDCNVVFSDDNAVVQVGENTNVKKISGHTKSVTVGDGKVGSIVLDNGDVYVTDGNVGDIDLDCTTGTGSAKVDITGGKVGSIDTTDADDSKGPVVVEGGTTGTITTKDTVTLTASDVDNAIVTGKITAPSIEAYADEAKITIGGIKAKADGTFTFKGDSLSTGTIDLDYRDSTVNFGDSNDAFIGKLASPINATNSKIATVNEDTDVTMTGAINADTISLDSDTKLSLDGAVTVDTIDGDGVLKVYAGKLYVTGSASSVTLKLADATLPIGTTAFKASTDVADVDSFNTYGFTVTKSAGNSIDTFKIASLSFAGPTINKTSTSIAKGYSETFTASAYPTGTSIPTGDTIKWDLDGGSSDVFTLTTTGNTATVKVNSIDSSFASENKTTLTATLYDADGYVLDDYDVAKCDINALSVPLASSDTNSAVSVAKGASYQMKVTSTTTPSVTTGTNGVFSVVLASKNGNNYFYKLTATGAVNASTGIFLNGTKIFVATVKAFAFTCDTTKATTVKGTYQFKITSATTPTVSVGSAAFKLAFVSKTGNAYFYKITSAGKAGAQAGIYVNGAKAFVATVG